MTVPTPAKAWERMVRGNERFVAGEPRHPRQDVDRRTETAPRQRPDAALFGCSDSRLAAEIIFDKGLGDLFVVRNAGQVVSDSVVGSLEYAVGVLGVNLIVVLGHDSCGAVQAAIDQSKPDATPLPAHIHRLVEQIVPSVREADTDDPTVVGRTHLRNTVGQLLQESELISDAVAAGTLAVVGANYRLVEGRVEPDVVVGTV
ncbi:MAG TPA: carbonic anhydrase [Rhodoglobus sp.]|nr:carbonic anhydrase [Rhodoglobus sp.]